MANFSEPMKAIEAMIYDGRIHHNGCPVLSWMVSNVVCHTNAKDEVYPRKEFAENKIDGLVGIIMAMRKWIVPEDEKATPSVYRERGIRTL